MVFNSNSHSFKGRKIEYTTSGRLYRKFQQALYGVDCEESLCVVQYLCVAY